MTDRNLKSIKTIKRSDFILENLKNIVSFTRFFKKICTILHYTEKNGTGVTLKWKREKLVLICGRKGRGKGFSAFLLEVPFLFFRIETGKKIY